MKELFSLAYVSAIPEDRFIPFARYLPPYYPGMAARLVAREAAPHALVLDPIGASPRSVLELASQFRVVVNCSNPILAFLIATLAKAPAETAFQSALADLSMLRRGTERIEEHLKSLYLTRCANCHQEVQANFFLYHRGEELPYARHYHCPNCGDTGLKPAEGDDHQRLAGLQRSYAMHRSRALDRASSGSADNLKMVNEVLNLYPPRALYFLFTLLNKVEGMKLDPSQEEVMHALLVSALDAGHTLNPWPETAESPRSLAQPEDSIERNLWQVMENTAADWTRAATPVNIHIWPQIPEETGLTIHRGRMRDLVKNGTGLSPQGIFSTIPRPHAAFWTLSAVWSAWLWGKENAAGFMSILERRRFDWNWHSLALHSAFAAAAKLTHQNTPVVAMLAEPSPGLSNAVFNAASAAGWKVKGISCASSEQPVQCTWVSSASPATPAKANTQRIIRDTIRQVLMDTGEPVPYTILHAAILAALACQGCLAVDAAQLRGELPSQLNKDIAGIFTDGKFLRHLGTPSADLETGTWWLTQIENLPESISDRIETSLMEYLQHKPSLDLQDAIDHLCSLYPGFLSPSISQVAALLASYAALKGGIWNLNAHDVAAKRAEDVATLQRLIRQTGAKLGYDVAGENPIDWIVPDHSGTIAYRLFTSETAAIGQLARLKHPEGCQFVYLFPGSRALLIHERIQRNKLLQEITASNWHFLKFRTMRHLAVRSDLSRELWALLIDSDPISPEETTQLSMFNL